MENQVRIRFRVDGVLHEAMRHDIGLHAALIARIKIVSGLDISEKRRPQDGRATSIVDRQEYDIRVSILPTVYGEKVVMRLAQKKALTMDKRDLGFPDDELEKFNRILSHPNGLILVTGPTGSGKTTTLYSVLQYLSSRLVNIVTIEDPVERNLPKINQIQVNDRAGLNFQTGLRSILRQDPDIIMIGETRDPETAEISARAAITGHLVFSTLHTNDAASSVTRLMDMGIPAYLAAASIAGIVSQRLMRKVCPYCQEEYEARPEELKILYGKPAAPGEHVRLRRGKGCYLCNETGYKGRIAIHEILSVDAEMKRMISEGRKEDELKAYAIRSHGMTTLKEEAVKMVLAGITTFEEMERLVYTIDMDYFGED